MTKFFESTDACAEEVLSRIYDDIKLGTPLGLGKPIDLLNAIYKSVSNSPKKNLTIYTALSLTAPKASSFLEKRFLNPFIERHFGQQLPLDYAEDLIKGKLAKNVKVKEFYMQAGVYPKESQAQRDYVSLNYTHVNAYLVEEGVQIIVQLIAKSQDGKSYSLSSNPDMTLDLKSLNKNILIVGVIHPDLPFMGHDALVEESFFDIILDPPKTYDLFALPKMPVEFQDIWIGLHASRVVKDDGTLQIGIGSLSDSLVKALISRHNDQPTYNSLLQNSRFPDEFLAETAPFETGLYGLSEMLMDGFMHLRKAGILKREIFDHELKKKRYFHGAFFLGSKELYEWLRNLNQEDWAGLDMTRVSKVNDLYDAHELALRRQRKNARFFNTCMTASVLGGAASETLENGQVISGVGGQFNFVTMSRELPDSRSILMLRSTRTKNGIITSNIVSGQMNLTIPRHLRDVVVTEYGVANLRGQSDSETIKRMILIADSRFQEHLLKEAKASHKVEKDYKIPDWARNNTPEMLEEKLKPHREKFPPFPFGSDFTKSEEKIVAALAELKAISHSKVEIARRLKIGMFLNPENHKVELERLKLFETDSLEEKMYQKLVMAGLELGQTPKN